MSNDERTSGRPPSFSQREGLSPYSTALQVADLNQRTRADIWNFVIYPRYVKIPYPDSTGELIWVHHLALPRDQFAPQYLEANLKNTVLDREWYELFDLIEFLANSTRQDKRQEMADLVNGVLELNRSGYRLIDGCIVAITSPEEMESIATAARSPIENARNHMKRALELFADRVNPNFPKVIAEAMSAAEAAGNILAGTTGLTFGAALKKVQKADSPVVHPSLIEGWIKLYGFTSDSGGIRHAMKDGTTQPDQNLAQYFLITCSAFVNMVAANLPSQP